MEKIEIMIFNLLKKFLKVFSFMIIMMIIYGIISSYLLLEPWVDIIKGDVTVVYGNLFNDGRKVKLETIFGNFLFERKVLFIINYRSEIIFEKEKITPGIFGIGDVDNDGKNELMNVTEYCPPRPHIKVEDYKSEKMREIEELGKKWRESCYNIVSVYRYNGWYENGGTNEFVLVGRCKVPLNFKFDFPILIGDINGDTKNEVVITYGGVVHIFQWVNKPIGHLQKITSFETKSIKYKNFLFGTVSIKREHGHINSIELKNIDFDKEKEIIISGDRGRWKQEYKPYFEIYNWNGEKFTRILRWNEGELYFILFFSTFIITIGIYRIKGMFSIKITIKKSGFKNKKQVISYSEK